MLWRDRLIGVVLGVALGLGVVVLFVFVFSEQTVDAPSLSSHPSRAHEGHGAAKPKPEHDATPPVATVRVIGGAPPPSGPAQLDYRTGDLVRLSVVSDATVDVGLLGYGIERAVPAGQPTPISFRASKPGSFPLLVTASHIDVARLTVAGSSH
jgi:hypothetical protein